MNTFLVGKPGESQQNCPHILVPNPDQTWEVPARSLVAWLVFLSPAAEAEGIGQGILSPAL